MLEHSSGPVPAEALMDDESVTDNFEYNSAPSFPQRNEGVELNEPTNSSLCCNTTCINGMDPIGGVPAEWLMCDDDVENNLGQLFPTTSASSVSSYVSTSVSNASAARERENWLRSEVEWLNYKVCQKMVKKKMRELNEEKNRMLHYYSETSALMSVYEKRKETLKKRQRRKAARERMKEAKRRFLSEFFNQPFEVTKGCERSIGVLKFCFFSISQR
uniref:Remorin_C domain-containing protein n=1 Tax=Ascaris lumbricoides TaxID=6252 RepID=A0A0M3IA04_ASCLU